MRRFLARFSEPVRSVHAPSWADFITATPVFKFSVQTGPQAIMDFADTLNEHFTGRHLSPGNLKNVKNVKNVSTVINVIPLRAGSMTT